MASTNLMAHLASAGLILGIIWLWWEEQKKVKLLKSLFWPASAIRVDFAGVFLKKVLEVSGVTVEFLDFHQEPKRIPMGACGVWLQKIPIGSRAVLSHDTVEIFVRDLSFEETNMKDLELASEPVSKALGCRIIYKKETA
jgi:hypothetical protein